MSKAKPIPLDKAPVIPKRMTGHRRSSLALYFRGEDAQESDEVQVRRPQNATAEFGLQTLANSFSKDYLARRD